MGRVLFLQHDSIFDGYGGVQYYLDDLVELAAESLGRDNVRTVIVRRTSAERGPEGRYSATFVPLQGGRLAAKLHNRLPVRLLRAACRVARELEPRLLVASHVSLAPGTRLISRWLGIPYAVIVYGTDCWGGLWPQDEWGLRNADRILSISHWTRDVLIGRGYDPDRIRIVHPRLSTPFETVAPKRPADADPPAPFTLLTVARLDARERYKGQDHTLEALARITKRDHSLPFRYIIQGDGDDRERLRDLASSLDLRNRVEFRPAIFRREDLQSLYRECDLFVMPSRFGKWDGAWRGEGFGIVYAEAAAVGVPSVAYRCGGVLDIIEDGENGWLVPPDDIESLSVCLERLIRDPGMVRIAGARARERVLREFTRPAVAAELVQALA